MITSNNPKKVNIYYHNLLIVLSKNRREVFPVQNILFLVYQMFQTGTSCDYIAVTLLFTLPVTSDVSYYPANTQLLTNLQSGFPINGGTERCERSYTTGVDTVQ